MGVEYRLLKLHVAESYDLGKARTPGRRGLLGRVDASPHREAWNVAQDGDDCVAVRLDERWPDAESLAQTIMKAFDAASDQAQARAIATDLLRWAGSDEVVLVTDGLDGPAIACREGASVGHWTSTGSAYVINRGVQDDAGERS